MENANIYFICPCGKHLAVDDAGVGRTVNCPDCGAPVTVPIPDVHWKCSCGSIMLAPDYLSGKTVKCYECKTKHQVPVTDKPVTTKLYVRRRK